MKKNKLKSLVKSARKSATKDIRLSLIAELNEITGTFGAGSKKLKKDIEQGSKQLAKKISKNIKIDKSAFIKSDKVAEATEVLEGQPVQEVATPKAKAKVAAEEVPAETQEV